MRDTVIGNILTDWKEDYALDFGGRDLHLAHSLHKSEMFSDEALVRLLEYSRRENYHVKATDEGGTGNREGDLGDLSGADILKAVRKGKIWINIQHPEAVDSAYGEMIADMYREFEARVPGLQTFKHMSTILISSPKVRVRYHADVPGQMLWQIRGSKRVWVYPNQAPYLRQDALEKLVLKRLHETDMPYDTGFDQGATVYDLEPGYMLYWPLNCPHRVENHDCMNVSVTTEHWTRELRNIYAVNYANGLLRNAGLRNLRRQRSGPGMMAKLAFAGAAKFSGMTRSAQKPYRIDFRVDPDSPTGYRDIDAYEFQKVGGKMGQAAFRETADIESFDVQTRKTGSMEQQKSPLAVDVRIADSPDAFKWLETDWRVLENQCEGAILFQTYDWCANFLDHACRNGDLEPGTVEMRVVTVRHYGVLTGLLPLAIRDDQGLRVLTGLTEPFQQYTEMLVAPGADPKQVFAQMLPKLRSSGADYLHFGQVRGDSSLFAAIDGAVPTSGEEDGAPYVPVANWPDFETYHQTVKAKTRKNMRNARNRLERSAPLVHRRARSGALLAEVIDRSFAGREAWLGRMGLTSRAFRNSGFGEFVERFKHEGKTGVPAIAFSLTHGDTPIADQWGFVHNGRYYAFMAGWDDAYEESSPGKLHLGAILEDCFTEGVELADFMIPAARYKFTWAVDAVPVRDYVMALTLRGRVQNAIWLNFLRPLAKRIVFALPTGMRAALFKVLMPGKA